MSCVSRVHTALGNTGSLKQSALGVLIGSCRHSIYDFHMP